MSVTKLVVDPMLSFVTEVELLSSRSGMSLKLGLRILLLLLRRGCTWTYVPAGTLVGFSFDGRKTSGTSSPSKTISFLKKNKVHLSHIMILASDHSVLDSLPTTCVPVYLYFNEPLVNNLRKPKVSTTSWLTTGLSFLQYTNTISIIVGSSSSNLERKQLSLLLRTLGSIHSSLKNFKLNQRVKVAVTFPLSVLENVDRKHRRELNQIVELIKKYKSFILVETRIDGEPRIGDHFIEVMMERAAAAENALSYTDVSMVLNVKTSAIPSAVEVADFTGNMSMPSNFRVSVAPVVPPLVLALAKNPAVEKFDLSSIRIVLSGAAPLGKELEEALKSRLPQAIFGQIKRAKINRSYQHQVPSRLRLR